MEYGKSMFTIDGIKRNYVTDDEINDKKDAFLSIENASKDEIDKMKDELINSPNNKQTRSKIVLDVKSGLKGTTIINEEDNDILKLSINEILNMRELKGKSLNEYGLSLYRDLMKKDPDEVFIKRLSGVFLGTLSPEYTDIEQVKFALGDELCDKVEKKLIDKGRTKETLMSIFNDLYNAYAYEIDYIDHMEILHNVCVKVTGDLGIEVKSLFDNRDILIDVIENPDKYDHLTKEDIDMIKPLIEDILRVLSFDDFRNHIKGKEKKLYRDINDNEKARNRMENWMVALRQEPTVVYALPMSYIDGITNSELVDHFLLHLEKVIVTEKNKEYMIEKDVTDIIDFYISKGYMTVEDYNKYKEYGFLMLYILSRLFKTSKLNTGNSSRLLSYTLDFLGKGIIKNRELLTSTIEGLFTSVCD